MLPTAGCVPMLIPFTSEHFNYIIEWVDSPELMHQYSGPDFPYPWTREMLQEYLQTVHDRDRFMYTEDGQMIGYGEVLYNGEFQPRLGRLLIGPKALRQKGYGAKMIKELIAYCKRTDPNQRVYLFVFTDNEQALKSYVRVGFQMTWRKPKYMSKPNKSVWLMHFD